MKVKVNEDMTQEQIVLEHLKLNRDGITQMEATLIYGITRLSSRIYNLRKLGYNIRSTNVIKHKGKKTINYARYTLGETA